MKIEELVAEGERISRPSVLLCASGTGEIAGYWGGERVDMPNIVPAGATALRSVRHVITVDAGLLPTLGIPARSSSLSLFEVTGAQGDVGYRVGPNDAAFRDIKCSGIPLFASYARSFPPFEALCLYGGEAVSSWLKSLGLERFEYYEAGARPEALEYAAEYTRRSPIYARSADAVLGGWHQIWAEDDFYLPLEMRLAVLTLRDAEPWLELWSALGLGNWSVRSHIT